MHSHGAGSLSLVWEHLLLLQPGKLGISPGRGRGRFMRFSKGNSIP